jgi:myo-inositol 2-dehydrogenase/D-chiro-inositol 1-dehydrogenase
VTAPHRIAVVGAGRIGRLHAANIARLDRLELAAVADPVPVDLGCETLADWRELLGRADVDAVAICSPTALHAEQVAAFAEAGKHVFCEKPLAARLGDADRALAAADAAEIVLQVGYNRRFDRNFAAVRELVASGRVGRPVLVRISSRDPEPPPGSYLAGRGPETIFVDTTSHDLDLVRFVTGENLVEVSARGGALAADEVRELGLVDTAVTTAVTSGGTIAAIDNTWRSAYGYDQRLEVHGTEGTAQAGNELRDTTSLADAAGLHTPPPPRFFLERYAASFRAELEAFAAALDGAPVAVTGRDGRAALAAALAAARSAEQGTVVRLAGLG